jgi:hypothetical protein
MAHPILKRVLPVLVTLSMSLCSWQALAQQNLVALPNTSNNASNVHRGSIVPMPTANAHGESIFASPFSHHGSGTSGLPRGLRYPGDLQYHGGSVLSATVEHTIYINPSGTCPIITCWGNPISFLTDLSNSGMIHVTDQYVGTNASNRYPVGTNFYGVGFTPIHGGTTFTDDDMVLIADLAAQVQSTLGQGSGFGLGHIYHIFLVPGQDLCFDSTYSVCYSPDNGATWFFCAYHGYGIDSVNGPFIYSAEPFQNVSGCAVQPGTPNGQLTDSTNNVLSHETIESITDPLFDGWWNSADNGLYGQEIGDECSFLGYSAGVVVGFGPNYVKLNGHPYAIQPEYSNVQHACSTSVSE